ncbi:MAG: hypothetical protein NC218_07205 [Acetobacter sp.]|nr:hypothetical protein [Acetobacter sp.]
MSEHIVLCPICGYSILPRESGVEMQLGDSDNFILICKDCGRRGQEKEVPHE